MSRPTDLPQYVSGTPATVRHDRRRERAAEWTAAQARPQAPADQPPADTRHASAVILAWRALRGVA